MVCREGLYPFSGLWVLVDKKLLSGGHRQKPEKPLELVNCGHYSENRFHDEQNKNRWDS